MKDIFFQVLPFLLLAGIISGCPMQTTPNASSEQQGLLQSIVGGKTEEESAQAGSTEKKSFDAISSHMAMVSLDEVENLPSGRTKRTSVESASAVILNENFIITSAHIFEKFKMDSNHVGFILFGASGDFKNRIRQEFSKNDLMNHSIEELNETDWSLKKGHKDFVFIRLRKGIPPGYSKINMMNDNSFFKNHKQYKAAGFGISENNTDDSILRVLDLNLSRYSIDQAVSGGPTVPPILGVEDLNYFLEFTSAGNASVMRGDSGGAIYYEGKDSNGNPLAFLAGIITGDIPVGNHSMDYALRVDAFYNEAISTAAGL